LWGQTWRKLFWADLDRGGWNISVRHSSLLVWGFDWVVLELGYVSVGYWLLSQFLVHGKAGYSCRHSCRILVWIRLLVTLLFRVAARHMP
jgi:hypothetical protein